MTSVGIMHVFRRLLLPSKGHLVSLLKTQDRCLSLLFLVIPAPCIYRSVFASLLGVLFTSTSIASQYLDAVQSV